MEIRTAAKEDANGIAKVHVESWKTTYKDLLSSEYLANLSHESHNEMWEEILEEKNSDSFHAVAVDEEGKIIGFISGGGDRSGDPYIKGELYAIYILESCQRQGLGQKLLLLLVEHLQGLGINNMLVWVLKDNPARQFYESLGASFYKEEEIEIAGSRLIELGLLWDDLTLLKEKLLSNR